MKREMSSGMILVICTMLIPLTIGFVGLVSDIGLRYLLTLRLISLTDSASHAGAVDLKNSGTSATAQAAVSSNILLNPINGQALDVSNYTVGVGTWNSATATFADMTSMPNAVRVTTNYSSNYYFFRLFGYTNYTINITSIAVVTSSTPANISIISQ